MNRRAFIKSIGASLAGIGLLPFLPKRDTSNDTFSLDPKDALSYEPETYYIHYDFISNTEYVIKDSFVIRETKHNEPPYVFFGETVDKIKSGEIQCIVFKKKLLGRQTFPVMHI